MAVVICFDREEDHERAIDVLAEAEETYHGVAPATLLVSGAALRALEANGVRFRVAGKADKERHDAPGA